MLRLIEGHATVCQRIIVEVPVARSWKGTEWSVHEASMDMSNVPDSDSLIFETFRAGGRGRSFFLIHFCSVIKVPSFAEHSLTRNKTEVAFAAI